MAKVRVYELAKQLGVETKEVVDVYKRQDQRQRNSSDWFKRRTAWHYVSERSNEIS